MAKFILRISQDVHCTCNLTSVLKKLASHKTTGRSSKETDVVDFGPKTQNRRFLCFFNREGVWKDPVHAALNLSGYRDLHTGP
jgi:hypothetical protein